MQAVESMSVGVVLERRDIDNPWRHSARELLAVLALHVGDAATAREHLTKLSEDLLAPRSMRKRAGEMLAVVGK